MPSSTQICAAQPCPTYNWFELKIIIFLSYSSPLLFSFPFLFFNFFFCWNIQFSSFNRSASPFGDCSSSCGGGIQTRVVVCTDSSGNAADVSLCLQNSVTPATFNSRVTQFLVLPTIGNLCTYTHYIYLKIYVFIKYILLFAFIKVHL